MTLQTVDENWTTALAIVAHPDDLEFGAAGAIARWTAQGKTVIYCMVTSGEAGIDAIEPTQAGPLREAEQIAAAQLVGVHQVDFLREPDGVIEYGVALRAKLALEIRKHRPDVVITGNFRERFGNGTLNQADHIAVGQAVLDAARDAGNRWTFNDQLTDGLEPWGGVTHVLVSGSPNPTHGLDTTENFDDAVASLEAHDQYIKGLGWDFNAREFLEGICSVDGAAVGAKYGTTFEVMALGFGGE